MEQKPTNFHKEPIGAIEDGTVEIDLVEVGYEILDKIKYVIITAILGVVIAAVYVFYFVVPTYQAVSKLYVVNSNDSVVNLSDFQLGNYLASDYAEMFKTWEVNEMVRTNLGLNYTYAELSSMVKMSNPADTRVLYISVTSADPQEAMLMANEYASVVSDYILKIMDGKKPNVLSSAILPDKPVSPKKATTMIIGLLLGVCLSVGIIVVRFLMNDTIKSPEDVEKNSGLPVLAVIPVMERQNESTKGRVHNR